MAEIKGVLLDFNLYCLNQYKKSLQNKLYKTNYRTQKNEQEKIRKNIKLVNECIYALREKDDTDKHRKRELEILKR